MEKQALLLISFILIGLEIISGCTDTNDYPTFEDTDGDGYIDTVDDFPDDRNLHVAIKIYDSNNIGDDPTWNISAGETKFDTWWVTNDSKYVQIKVDALRIIDGTTVPVYPSEITISLRNPEKTIENNYGQFGTLAVSTRNWGEWLLTVTNIAEFDIVVNVAIYILK
jgi:hypothetical protein